MVRFTLLSLLVACAPTPKVGDTDTADTAVPQETGLSGDADEDADGYRPSEGDCDEGNAEVSPGATEICNGIDDNCNDVVDEDVEGIYYADTDGDGFGDATSFVVACEAPDGYVQNNTDCDDARGDSYPGAVEVCDSADNDCDGAIDEDSVTTFYWTDTDGDGHGDPDLPLYTCAPPADAVATNDDCDDTNSAIHPGADESDCLDPVDYNCDGSVGYADADGDGWAACAECDDLAADVSPGATEVCNTIDDNCDGAVDEAGADGEATWYADADGDSFGDPATAATACEAAEGWVADATDCDDTAADTNPDAEEVCDGLDQDCDGTSDEGLARTWYTDADGDTWGDDTTAIVTCDAPADASDRGGDCDDTLATVSPDAAEACNGIDDNCDGATDEGVGEVWYTDADGDGYGDASAIVVACETPEGAVSDDSDCDDTSDAVRPDADESCNDTDDDCDGSVDESATDVSAWYYDGDGDGYGNPAATTNACDQPAGWVDNAQDCNDGAALASPAGVEVCDGVDNDCDGTTDEGGTTTWYRDLDGDGYGDLAVTASSCSAPVGYVATSSDCDDTVAAISPAAAETCDGIDNDCDGSVDETGSLTFYADTDGDGYGDASSVVAGCTLPAGYVTNDDDCNDAANATHPLGTETCDGTDEDCDGTVDDNTGDTWYRDADGDGYGSTSSTLGCSQPSGYVDNDDDCNDLSSSYSPGAAEVCDDSLDQDCDGTADDGCPDTVTHCGTISASETWAGEDIHVVTCDIYVQGTASPLLTIEDGATVEFAAGAGLYVGWGSYGELWVDGNTEGVTFTSGQTRQRAGDWEGINIGSYDRGSWIEGATIEYGGYNGAGNVYVLNSSLVTILDSTITDSSESGVYVQNATVEIAGTTMSDNADYGLYLHTNAALYSIGGVTFTDNVMTGNALYPMTIPAASLPRIDGSNSFAGNTYDSLYVHTGTVANTTTLAALDVPYYISGDVAVGTAAGMVFTVEDGAELRFASGAGLNIGTAGYTDFVVEGSTRGVTFTSSRTAPNAGDWDGVTVWTYSQDVSIAGATIAYGGANGNGGLYLYNADAVVTDSVIHDSSTSGIFVSWYSTLNLQDSTVEDNADYGVYVYDYAELDGDASVDGNTITGNNIGVSIPFSDVGALGSDGTYTGNITDDIEVVGDTCATTSTMRDLDAYWHITEDVAVGGSARPTLTVADGAELRFDPGAGLTIGNSGSPGRLDIDGTALGVVLTSSETSPGAGDWDGITFTWSALDSTLTNCDIGYGGGNGYGNVYMIYSGYSVTAGAVDIDDCVIHDSSRSGIYMAASDELAVTNSTISDNADYGVYVPSGSALETDGEPSFSGNTVTGNGLYPLYVYATSMDQLDDNGSYTGNGTDRVFVDGGTVTASGTWRDLDAPWYISSDINVYASSTPTITIASGTTLLFNTLSGLHFGQLSNAKLIANGTATEPIVFTSAQTTPSDGDWDGIALGTYDTGSTLSYVEVSYGGSGFSGNIHVYSNGSRVSISDATVSYSEEYGIYRSGATPTLTNVTYVGNTSGTLY